MISWDYWSRGEFELAKQSEIKCMQLDPLNARYPWGIGLDYSFRRGL